MFTQSQYNLLTQNIRRLHIKIGLLSQDGIAFDYLEGLAVDGSIDVMSNSSHRRSGSLTMVVTEGSNLIPSKIGKIWFNRKIEVQAGLEGAYSQEKVWFDLGRFAISEANLDRAIGVKQISITMLDYTSFLDGTLGGQVADNVSIVNNGVTVKQALKATLQDLGSLNVDEFKVTNILTATESDATVPYDINQQPGSTVFDLVSQLVSLYKGYEVFYDPYGILRIQRVKDLRNDPIIWDFATYEMGLVMNYSSNVKFSNVHNDIVVWGHYDDDTAEQIYWRYRNRHVVDSADQIGSLPTEGRLEGDIVSIANENRAFAWINENWTEIEFKVVSDFCIDEIGTKTMTISEEKIFNIEQAQLRAEYELWNYSNFAETINLSCVPIYYLDVNQLIKVKEDSIGVDGVYRIDSISIPLTHDGLMNITATKMYY